MLQKKRKACKSGKSKLFGQNCNILLSKKAKQSVPKEKKYFHQRCLQEKTSSKRTEQLLFLHTSQWLCCEQNFPAQNKKSLKKNVTKKNTKGDENELTRLLSNNKHSFLLRTKIVTSLEERICWVSITQKDVLNLVTPLPQVQFNKIL